MKRAPSGAARRFDERRGERCPEELAKTMNVAERRVLLDLQAIESEPKITACSMLVMVVEVHRDHARLFLLDPVSVIWNCSTQLVFKECGLNLVCCLRSFVLRGGH